MSGAVKFGNEFLINTTAEWHQYQPAMAAFSSGGFVTAWTDLSGLSADHTASAIRAQIFDASGAKAGAELLVNTTTTGSQNDPTVTTLSDGRFVVAWADYSGVGDTGSGPAVRAQIFNANGTKSGTEFHLSTTGEGPEPVITGLADGRFVAAWSTFSAAGNDTNAEGIRAQVFNADGTKSGGEFQANTTTIGSQSEPVITPLADGHFVLAWTDASGTAGDQSQRAIRAHVFTADGAPVGNEFLVNTTTLGDQSMPTITGLANGRFVAAWSDLSQTGGDTDRTSVRAQIFDAAGTKLGAEFLVNTTTVSDQYTPSIVGLRDGRFVAAWTDYSATGDDTSQSAVRAQVFNTDGTKSGDEFVVNTTIALDQYHPTITALFDGRFVVTWEDVSQTGDDASGLAVRAQIFDSREAAVHLKGTPGDDDFIGTRFDDTMRGGGGNDQLDGGAGDDTAIFFESRDKYTLQALGDGKFMVSGPDGVDTLANFEHLRFADVTLDADKLHAPTITSDGGGDTATHSVRENHTAVTTVSAIDADPGTTLTYAISGGADSSKFQINASTGALSFITAPDFGTPTDSDHNNSYIVQVRASDGSLFDDQIISVNVSNLDARFVGSDFNGDGKGDILWQNSDGTPAAWLMDGTSMSSTGVALTNPGSAWHEIGSADFNGDGKADILWQNADGTPAVWLMDGTNVLSTGPALFNPGPSWHAMEAADFDGDGKADILWQNDNGTPAVWLMDGVNVRSTGPALPNPGANWHEKAAADFDGDGKADILWQNADGTPAVWLMDGMNVCSIGPALSNPGPSWHEIAAADFNADGNADILWQNDDGTPAVWLMDGTTVLATGPALTNPGAAWHAKEAADYNGDGKADILWQHNDGTPAVWLMNGTAVTSFGSALVDPGAAWHII